MNKEKLQEEIQKTKECIKCNSVHVNEISEKLNQFKLSLDNTIHKVNNIKEGIRNIDIKLPNRANTVFDLDNTNIHAIDVKNLINDFDNINNSLSHYLITLENLENKITKFNP